MSLEATADGRARLSNKGLILRGAFARWVCRRRVTHLRPRGRSMSPHWSGVEFGQYFELTVAYDPELYT